MPVDDRLRLHKAQPMPEHLAQLVANRSTGILVANSGPVRRRLVFQDGEACSVQSQLEKEMLGSWLVQRDRIIEGQRALTLLSQGSGEDAKPLGRLLVERGYLDQETLDEEVPELALTIVSRAAAAPETCCEFEEDRDAAYPRTLGKLSTAQILLVAARAFDDLEMKKTSLGSLDQAVWASRGLDSLLAEVVLTPTEGFLLSRLSGTETLSNLIRLSSLPEEQAIATVYSLTVTGVLNVGPAPQPARAPEASRSRSLAQAADKVPAVDESTLGEAELAERRQIIAIAESAPRVDHYRALNLDRDATHDQIVEAWKRTEDTYSDIRLEQPHLRDLGSRFNAIVERARDAYELLSRPKARRRYDPILEAIDKERRTLETGHVRPETDPGARREIVEANFKRADELVREGEVYLAIQLLEHAVALEPRPAQLLKLARLLLRNPLWTNRALTFLRRATEIDPTLVEGWIELAEFWRRRNNLAQQRLALEKALAEEPQNQRACTMYRLLVGKRELERLHKKLRRSRP